MTRSTEEGPSRAPPRCCERGKDPGSLSADRESAMQPRDAAVTINSPSGDTSLSDHEIVEVKSPGDGSPTLPQSYRADRASRVRAALTTLPFRSHRASASRN